MATKCEKAWSAIKEWWFIPAAFIIWMLYIKLLPTLTELCAATTIGEWGDSFGGLNALVSGLAFFILIKTLLTQKEELRLQRKELEATRFERTFFQFLEMVDKAYHAPESVYGGNPFEDIMRPDVQDKNDYNLVMGVKPFFSLLYTVLEFIDKMDGPDAEKKLYCSVLRDKIGENGLRPFLWAGTKPDWCKEKPSYRKYKQAPRID